MALLAIAGSYAVATLVFQRAPLNADENSYVFQAHNFISGKVSHPAPPNLFAFRHKMIITDQSTGWLSRYPFGHPLFLAPAVWLGIPYVWVALSAGLSLLFIMLAAGSVAGRAAAFSAGALVLLSPFFYFYHGTLLSHSSGLLATSLMLWAYIRWRLAGQRRMAVMAGLAWAFFLNNRTYTALLIAVPFGMDALWQLYLKRDRQQWMGTICFAGAAVSGLVGLLLYNELSTGDYRKMTYLVYNPTETLGFGSRIYGRINHTLERGLLNMRGNVELLNIWLFGFKGSLLVWLALALAGWRKEWTRLCVLPILFVVLGYVYFWYVGPQEAGPSYYFEIIPFLALSGSFGVVRIIPRLSVWPLIIGALVMAYAGGQLAWMRGMELREANQPRRAFLNFLATVPADSLIFIESGHFSDVTAGGNDLIFNPHGLHSDPLLAHWMPNAHRAMVERFQDRAPLRLIRDDNGFMLIPAPAPAESLELDYPIVRTGFHQGVNQRDPETGRWLRVAEAGQASEGLMAFGYYQFVHPSQYELIVELRLYDPEDGDPAMLRIDVAAEFAKYILLEETIAYEQEQMTIRLPFMVDECVLIEPRLWFLGKGRVELIGMRLRELG